MFEYTARRKSILTYCRDSLPKYLPFSYVVCSIVGFHFWNQKLASFDKTIKLIMYCARMMKLGTWIILNFLRIPFLADRVSSNIIVSYTEKKNYCSSCFWTLIWDERWQNTKCKTLWITHRLGRLSNRMLKPIVAKKLTGEQLKVSLISNRNNKVYEANDILMHFVIVISLLFGEDEVLMSM